MKVDGEAVTLPGCLLLDFTDEWLCRRLREYWHFLPGEHRPPDEWGSEPSGYGVSYIDAQHPHTELDAVRHPLPTISIRVTS